MKFRDPAETESEYEQVEIWLLNKEICSFENTPATDNYGFDSMALSELRADFNGSLYFPKRIFDSFLIHFFPPL